MLNNSKFLKVSLVIPIILGSLLTGCSNQAQSKTDEKPVVVGSIGSDVKVWQHIAKSKEAKDEGLKLKVRPFNDGTVLNKATLQGEVDVNTFQSKEYLKAFNKASSEGKIADIGTSYIEPMGIYSKKHKSIKNITAGTTFAIPNNIANEIRALYLLQSAGLIKLGPKENDLDGIKNVKSNPYKINFKEIDDTTGPRVLDSVDYAVINNTIAFEGGLNVLQDSLYHESPTKENTDHLNVIAVSEKNKNNPKYKKLVKLFHNKNIQAWIKNKFSGTKVEVKN